MADVDLRAIEEFVNEHVDNFHQSRIARIQSLELKEILKRKNPYLFRAKNLVTAPELLGSLIDAYISSSEETLFGTFLESLAIFVCQQAHGGQKSSAAGIDLEFTRDGIRYIVAVKSSPNWGNSSQYQSLELNFRKAISVLRQSHHIKTVQAVLGMCFGKSRDADSGVYLKKYGQSFWTFISGSPSLYIDIIEPLDFRARERNVMFEQEKLVTITRMIVSFAPEFCYPSGHIDWAKLIAFNSGNLMNSDTTP